MKFFVIIVCLLYSVLCSATTYDSKINLNQKKLKNKSKIERKIARQLNEIAKDIISEQRRLQEIERKIDELSKNITINENRLKQKESSLKLLEEENSELLGKKKKLEKKIIDVVAKNFSFSMISDKEYIDSIDGILTDEAIKKIGLIVQKEVNNLSKNYEQINKQINLQNRQIENLKEFIKDLKSKKDRLFSLKKEKQKSIKKLADRKYEYKKRLIAISKERELLRKTLKKLKILRQKENEKKKEKRENRIKKALKDRKVNGKMTVRQIGSSYQNSRVKRYKGPKTIAPLDKFVVKRKFGAYVDPIYKIKIFNEAVILKSKIKNAKVRNVLDGKIVYAKKTSVLDNVVIVENVRGIHTIYAHLSKIAPTIKVGKKVRRGYIIGRIHDELSFEVTQKSYHINPLELIRY